MAKPSVNTTQFMRSFRKLDFEPSIEFVEKDRVIFQQGDPADECYFILSGSIKITVLSDQGKVGVIGIVSNDEIIGECCIAGRSFYLETATTIERSSVVAFSKRDIETLMQKSQLVSRHIIDSLLFRNAMIKADLADQLFNSTEKRLARLLLQLTGYSGDQSLRVVVPKVSQSMLAEKVGTTRSQINIHMNKFRKLGLIDYNGNLKVHPSLINLVINE